MSEIRSLTNQIINDTRFRNALRKAKTPSEKMQVIKKAGYNISNENLKMLIKDISKIFDKKFNTSTFNFADCQSDCETNCQVDPCSG